MEALHVVAEVAVPDADVHAAGLLRGRMGQVVVVGGLEGEAFAAQVHLEEGLRAGVELAVARPLRIAGLDGLLGVARRGAGRDEAAVEDHRGAGDVLHRARPQRRLDAVARVVLVVAQRGHRRGVAVVVLAAGGVEGGGAHAARHLELVGDDHGAGFAHVLVDVLEHVVALVHPHVDEVVVARAAGIASPLAVQAGAVGVVALVGEGLGVDGVEPVARGAHLGALLA